MWYIVMQSFDILLPCSSRTWLICFQSRCQLENKKKVFFTLFIPAQWVKILKNYAMNKLHPCPCSWERMIICWGKNHLLKNFSLLLCTFNKLFSLQWFGPVFFFFPEIFWHFRESPSPHHNVGQQSSCSNVNKESSCLCFHYLSDSQQVPEWES